MGSDPSARNAISIPTTTPWEGTGTATVEPYGGSSTSALASNGPGEPMTTPTRPSRTSRTSGSSGSSRRPTSPGSPAPQCARTVKPASDPSAMTVVSDRVSSWVRRAIRPRASCSLAPESSSLRISAEASGRCRPNRSHR